MPTRVITPPAIEPVDLDAAKVQCRVDTDDEDDYLDGLIATARLLVEASCHRALITQTLELTADDFPRPACDPGDGPSRWRFDGRTRPDEAIPLRPAVQSVESVTYTDVTGATQSLDPSAYRLDARGEPGRLLPAYAACWPATRCGDVNAVTVTYVAGYGDAADDVPRPLRQAILLLVAHLYANREPVNIGNITTPLPFTVDALIDPYRVGR